CFPEKIAFNEHNRHAQYNGGTDPDELFSVLLRRIKDVGMFGSVAGCINIYPANGNQNQVEKYRYPIHFRPYVFLSAHYWFFSKSASIIRFSTAGLDIESVRYFSMIRLVIGAAQVLPKPTFS